MLSAQTGVYEGTRRRLSPIQILPGAVSHLNKRDLVPTNFFRPKSWPATVSMAGRLPSTKQTEAMPDGSRRALTRAAAIDLSDQARPRRPRWTGIGNET
jgi:hypothetical protein